MVATRALAVVVLAVVSALAFRAELTANEDGVRPFLDFPMSAFLGTFATAIGIRIAVPIARRSNEDEFRTIVELFVVGTLAFALARWGVLMFYRVGVARLPVAQDWATRMMSIAALAVLLGGSVAVVGWTSSTKRLAPRVRRLAPLFFALAMLAVVPSASVVLSLVGERDDLPNVVASGLTPFFTVVYAAIAARTAVRADAASPIAE